MFDLTDSALTRRRAYKSPIPGAHDAPAPTAMHPLDEEPRRQLHQFLLDAYVREIDRQRQNRIEQATDEDFYDNEQWRPEDKREVENRGQSALVYNVIATTVNWVLGTERRGRSDFKVLPRRKQFGRQAERKSQLLKYLADCNRTSFARSRAFADAVKVGIGWLEDCYDDSDGQEPIVSRYESWRNMLWDSAAQRDDLEDARYIFRSKWIDADLLAAAFPDRTGIIELSIRDTDALYTHDDYGDDAMDDTERELERVDAGRNVHRGVRSRVRAIEAWFKLPEKVTKITGGTFSGEIFDPHSRGHRAEIENGEAETVEKSTMRVYCAILTTQGLLWCGPSPYRHNRYPFTPIWANRRGRNRLPYGMVRGLRGIQEDINKRASKALHLFTTKRVIADANAVADHDEAAEEVARPDAYIVKRPGTEFRVETDHQLADGHIELMARSIAMVQQASGVTDENQGRRTNATSGIAIERRQTQGAMATSHYFDGLRLACQIQGEKQLSLIEQFMTERKQFRITNMRGAPDYIEINDGLPENDITRSKADYVISEADWRASMREAAAAELMDVLVKLAPAAPDMVMVLLDLLVESMDIPNRDEIVKRIRSLTGQRDPDAEEPTPEEAEREAAKQRQAQLQEQQVMAALRRLMAQAAKDEALADKARADTAKVKIASLGGPKRGVIDIAADLLTAPAIAPMADDIAREAGFLSRSEADMAAAVQTNHAAQAAEQAATLQQQQESPQ